MNNHITIELCAEDRARLDAILAGLANLKHDCKGCVEAVMHGVDEVVKTTTAQKPQNTPQEAVKEDLVEMAFPPEEVNPPWETSNPFPEKQLEPAVTVADVQKKVIALAAAGKKAEMTKVVKAYADRVSLIPEDKLAEVFAKLTALEG